jgi:hypothetical protein
MVNSRFPRCAHGFEMVDDPPRTRNFNVQMTTTRKNTGTRAIFS